MDARGVGAYLVTDITNIRYLTGFTGSNAFLLVTGKRAVFLTDARYTVQARDQVRGASVRVFKKPAPEELANAVKGLGARTVAFEGDDLSFDSVTRLRKAVKGVRLKSVPGLVPLVRRTKEPKEIDLIEASAALLVLGFERAKREIRAGRSEKEAAASIEVFLRKKGSDGPAFETIVASGPRGALPHGKASERRIGRNELVVVDMGVLLDGYNSDETRTFVTGRPTRRQREVYDAVKDAQARAIESIRAGVRASEVDRAARDVISKAGLGRYFTHSTGHGVGLSVHEGPVVGPKTEGVLEEGMVVTVEPGVYIPGWGGVRIEDMVAVEKDGARVLTSFTRELTSL